MASHMTLKAHPSGYPTLLPWGIPTEDRTLNIRHCNETKVAQAQKMSEGNRRTLRKCHTGSRGMALKARQMSNTMPCTGQSWRYASSMACACNALGQDWHERMKRIRCTATTPHPIQQRKHCDGAIPINTSISLILVEGCHETTCQLAWPWSASFYCIKEICERLWKNLGKVCKVTSRHPVSASCSATLFGKDCFAQPSRSPWFHVPMHWLETL